MKVLMAWVGNTDLTSAEKNKKGNEVGPIAQAIQAYQDSPFDKMFLLYNYPADRVRPFIKWLEKFNPPSIQSKAIPLKSPTNYEQIYRHARKHIDAILAKHPDAEFTFHLSPGTPAMAAIWLLLAKTLYPATLIEASREAGVKIVKVPFEISVDFLPQYLENVDRNIEKWMQALPDNQADFSKIIYQSKIMDRVVAKARKVAVRTIPVLIEGESGTGKELFSRAIHNGGLRQARPFIAVNCGAISPELIESELFGHAKGAFTGASQTKKGYFESADGGTLFLDEIAELPLSAQVKLLRVLQEKEIQRVGESKTINVNVRIIAASHENLLQEVSEGRFREDLFYRLAVAILKLPPLRERKGDLKLLINAGLERINEESAENESNKSISVSAKKFMVAERWPGNIRELFNTLQRAALWCNGDTISLEDIRGAMLRVPGKNNNTILGQSLDEAIDLEDLMAGVAKHYLERALEKNAGNKTQAAKLLGLSNYQTLSNWMKKYGIEK